VNDEGIFGERYEARIARAINHVEQNPGNPLSLEKLSSIACLSPFHFHRVFRSLTGETVHRFTERRKLEHAIALARSGKSWKVASGASGFGSSISFTRAFKRVYGVAPSRFDLASWWKDRADRDNAQKISSYFLRPAPPLDQGFKVDVVAWPRARLAVSRAWGGYLHPDRLIRAYSRLRKWADACRIDTYDGKMSGGSRDDPDLTPLSRCRYDFQIEIPDDVTPPSHFSVTERTEGYWVVAPAAGGLEVIDRTWSMLFKSWLPASGLDLRDEAAVEVYRKLPEEIGWSNFDLLCCVPVMKPENREKNDAI
jgi:AraC family transcriptional regulator